MNDKALYFVFAGDNHYPESGFNDLKGIFKDYQEATKKMRELESEKTRPGSFTCQYDWVECCEVDTETLEWKDN
jgi:hypothetical protein